MKNQKDKQNKVSYYVGWGIALRTFFGSALGFYVGVAIGALIAIQ